MTISARSTLIIEGEGKVTIHELELDGALRIRATAGAIVDVRGLVVRNRGWELTPVDTAEELAALPVPEQMRGFRLERHAITALLFDTTGHHAVSGDVVVNSSPAPQSNSQRLHLPAI